MFEKRKVLISSKLDVRTGICVYTYIHIIRNIIQNKMNKIYELAVFVESYISHSPFGRWFRHSYVQTGKFDVHAPGDQYWLPERYNRRRHNAAWRQFNDRRARALADLSGGRHPRLVRFMTLQSDGVEVMMLGRQ